MVMTTAIIIVMAIMVYINADSSTARIPSAINWCGFANAHHTK